MIRWRACLTALAAFSLAAAPAAAQSSAPPGSRFAAGDVWRAETIARIARSIVRIKTVHEAATRPSPGSSESGRKRGGRVSPDIRAFLDQMAPARREGGGTGFVIDAGRGLVLTAAHVLDKAATITVILPNGGERPAERVGIDEARGFAVLRVAGAGVPSLAFSPHATRTGDAALIVGHMVPLRSVLATQGMVMGKTSDSDLEGRDEPGKFDYWVLDASIPNGSFGGSPVIGADGQVIGVVFAIFGTGFGANSLTVMVPAQGLAALIATMTNSATSPVSQRN